MIRSNVAVLYVDARGPYPGLVADWYDETRDAETYAGLGPVVAHPPCGPWGRLKHLNRYQDPRHALHAVDVVRRVGGVLEHPHGSSLWKAAGLPLPGQLPDVWGGWTLEIDQCRFGHVARKLTWLYLVGATADDLPPIPPPRDPTHWVARAKTGGKGIPDGIKQCSAEARRRTPPAFARWLIELAAKCRKGAK